MLLFEYDSGQLFAARLGVSRSKDVDPGVMTAVRDSVLEIIGRPLFSVQWQSSGGNHAAPGEPHRLVAMDPAGQAVSVEVLGALDSVNLVGALARAGRTAALGWMEIANMYPRGTSAFRRDWNAFRESLPPRPTPGPRLFVVTSAILDDVRPSLEMLAESGVEVFEVSQREAADGRIFVEIIEPARVLGPTISALPGAEPAHLELVTVDPEQVQRLGIEAPADEDEVRMVAGSEPANEPETESEPPAAPAPQSAPPAAPAGFEEWIAPHPGLSRIAGEIGEQTELVWMQLRKGIRTAATLRTDGLIELEDGRHFADPSEAANAAARRQEVEGWRVWRLTEGGPTLAEAMAELGENV